MTVVAAPSFPGTSASVGRELAVGTAVGVAVLATFVVAPISGASPGAVRLEAAGRLAVAGIPAAVGLYSWRAAPFRRLGALLVAGGVVWLVGRWRLTGVLRPSDRRADHVVVSSLWGDDRACPGVRLAQYALGRRAASSAGVTHGDPGATDFRSEATQSASEREDMTDASLDELGPVDYIVVEFPAGASNFTGEMAKELLALVDSGTIRVIDVLILTKNEDGTVDATELSDVGELGELQAIEAQLAELLAEEDVEHLAAAMEPGSTAGVLIWENLWAAPFAAAARRSGGQLIANGRIPIQAIIASLEADEALTTVGD
jgi:hypothetical protein